MYRCTVVHCVLKLSHLGKQFKAFHLYGYHVAGKIYQHRCVYNIHKGLLPIDRQKEKRKLENEFRSPTKNLCLIGDRVNYSRNRA